VIASGVNLGRICRYRIAMHVRLTIGMT
jgi:hypothetical protein